MTPLGKIEAGITDANWQLVCDGFNKLTGKKMEPPIIKVAISESFDPNKAKKTQLYKWLQDKIEMGPSKEYSTEELREIANVHLLSIEPDMETVEIPIKKDAGYINPDLRGGPYPSVDLPDGAAFLDGFRYTSGKKKLLPMDTLKVVATLDPQLAKVGDPTNEYTPREPPRKAQLTCLKCSKVFEGYAGIGVTLDGQLKALCPVCREII